MRLDTVECPGIEDHFIDITPVAQTLRATIIHEYNNIINK